MVSVRSSTLTRLLSLLFPRYIIEIKYKKRKETIFPFPHAVLVSVQLAFNLLSARPQIYSAVPSSFQWVRV